MSEQLDCEQMETDRKEASRNIYGMRSLLSPGQCQHCGSDFGMIKVWANPEDIADDGHTWEPCPECNPQ